MTDDPKSKTQAWLTQFLSGLETTNADLSGQRLAISIAKSAFAKVDKEIRVKVAHQFLLNDFSDAENYPEEVRLLLEKGEDGSYSVHERYKDAVFIALSELLNNDLLFHL